ncbi:polymer-forming cytoskeletal protein [Haloterrigena gelatinilytica]|uniref:polymer-forming cytoskeletal protein n=1 Tax=Haloterrigena gelatinilytica TaxID=2741724 RepID=UPI002111C5EA|nr:polymer-forming cytoskeletal protein [Haloterrigena gelatinilytica]
MRIRQLQWGDRGISIVIGTVLLVGIVTITMAILATAILGTDFIDQSPEADIVYEEDQNGTVLIALADARGLSAGNTELQLRGAGSCGSWDGDGTLGKGSVTLLEGSDCPDSLEEGDVIQVIGSDTLIDTYELRGPFADFGCEAYESELKNGDPIIIEDGDTVACDLTDDGSRLPNDIRVRDGGTLIGNINTSGVLEITDATVDGNVDSLDGFDLKVGSVVDGDVTADVKNVYLRDGSDVEGSIESLDSGKDVYLEVGSTESSTVGGDLMSERHVIIKDSNTVEGNVIADEEVQLKKNAIVEGDVLEGEITECGSGAEINGEPCHEHENYTGS